MPGIKTAQAGGFLTQRQVIDMLYARAMKTLRGEENESVIRLLKAYRVAQDELIARLTTGLGGTTGWSYNQFLDSGRLQALLGSVEQTLSRLQVALEEEIGAGAMLQFRHAYDKTAWALDQATPPGTPIKFARPPEDAVRILVNTPYRGAMFSQRIGIITNAMAADIRDQLTQSLIQGEGIQQAAERLTKVMGLENLKNPRGYANRAAVIARSEIMRAQNLARGFTYEQNKDLLDEDETEWLVTPDDRLCPWCLRREGKTDKEIEKEDPGEDPWGNDTEAPLHPNCVPAGQFVLAPQVQAATKASYRGRIIEVRLSDGSEFAVTENHPVLTPTGWLRAKLLRQGGHVISSTDPKGMMKAINPDHNDSPAKIEQVFSALKMAVGMASRGVKTAPEDFHGDAAGFDGQIEIVGANGLLRHAFKPAFFEQLTHQVLSIRKDLSDLFASLGRSLKIFLASATSSHGSMGSGSEALALPGAGAGHACEHCGRAITGRDAEGEQSASDNIARHTMSSSELFLRYARFVQAPKIVEIKTSYFSGHVYDLQSGFLPIYICNGVIVHNCRCTKAPKLKSWSNLIGLDMPEELSDDARGIRNPEGKWEIAPVEKFDAWLERRAGELGVEV